MTVFATIGAALLTAIIEASILPWAPFLAMVSVTSIGSSVLVATGHMGIAALFTAVAGGVLAYLSGAPAFSRTLIMVTAVLALVPVRELIRSGHTVATVIVVSIVLGIAARGTLALTMPAVAAVGVAALGNAIVAGAWFALRRAPRMQRFR